MSEKKKKIDPFSIMPPDSRWVPTTNELRELGYNFLLPPLVHKIREAVFDWRLKNYEGATDTSKQLLKYWFQTEHSNIIDDEEIQFQYYFSQREAMESIIYLYEVVEAHDKFNLMRFDSSGLVSTGHFYENWTRYVIKMATGSGKTKVASLVTAWSYFNKLYENESKLSKNILLIAPNIIVLNRLKKDFEGLKIYKEDPIIPEDGFADKNWQSDFQITVHIQDEVKAISPAGNLFLTNIHRVFLSSKSESSFDDDDVSDFFLGSKPSPEADKDKGTDLGKILRSDKIKDILIINDEAHHIHDESLAWFKNIEDIHNTLLQKNNGLSLQVDFTATPKHRKGEIFVQTICDYPLVEAIKQNVVKSLVLPDLASRAKLKEKDSDDFIERYEDYINLGVVEWQKQFDHLKKIKTPLLFIMTTTTKQSDEVKEYLENRFPIFKDSVLLIHTNKSGEISESTTSKKSKDELDYLRNAADHVDSDQSPYKAIVSVLMLREGWDVKNVTTVVGLRPYSDNSKILPEQTIGRGLRKMFPLYVSEELAVIGTKAFIDFVESIKVEGVELVYRKMGKNYKPKQSLIIETDKDNPEKDMEKLDIPIPVLTPRIYREYKKLELLNINEFHNKKVNVWKFKEEELREIVFTDLDGEFSHKIEFENTDSDYRNVISFFTNAILKESRLFSSFEVLYPKVRDFIEQKLFTEIVDLNDKNILRNLSEPSPKKIIFSTFKDAISRLTISDSGSAEVKNYIKLRKVKPSIYNNQEYLTPKKSILNKIVGDSKFELEFASFLDECDDIISFIKNILRINFKIEYKNEEGNISNYYPDFVVKKDDKTIYIIETKGREDLEDIRKIKRLTVWCKDVNKYKTKYKYHPLYVKQKDWDKYKKDIKSFEDVIKLYSIKEEK
ncbi:MAG: type III restriction endonuclease subunit R [Candidatus Cloacimonas sp. SDB]|nr:MAG: type III restriction endonuclease subunit R [Candidatus Cloacimonas sp. SDB]